MSKSSASRTKSSRLRIAVAVLAVLALAAACGEDEPSGEGGSGTVADGQTPRKGGEAIFGLDAESDGYNPVTKRFAQAGHMVAAAVFDPLATLDEDGNWEPFLATSIEPNDEYTAWTVTIPEGIEFHNGDPLDAEALVEVMRAHKEGLVTSSTMTEVESIEAVDEYTIRFDLTRPWVRFPLLLTTQVGYVMAPSMLTDPDSGAAPVGTGPFVLEEWQPGEYWRGTRNPDYWRTDENGVQLPYLDAIEFRFLPDAIERNEALSAGDIDLLHTLTPQAILDLRDSDSTVLEYNRGDEDVIALNTSVAPFDNVHARRALAFATDQPSFIEEMQRGVNPAATGPFAPDQLGYREETGYPGYDPDKAGEELTTYEQETGGPLRFTYTAPDDVDAIRSAQYLVEMWSEVGIEAEIEAVPQADVIFLAVTGQFEVIDWRNWSMLDPDGDYQWWHSSSVRPLAEGISINVAHFADDEIDEALQAARASTDDDERDELYAWVAERFGEAVPYLWLGRIGWAIAGAPNIHGYEVSVENGTLATIGAKTWMGELWISEG